MRHALAARTTLDLLGGKWVPMILTALATGPRRPKTLLHTIGNGMPKKVLLETLRRMETQQLTTHTGVYRDGQTEVHYSLTQRGRSLLPVIDTLAQWADADEKQPAERTRRPATEAHRPAITAGRCFVRPRNGRQNPSELHELKRSHRPVAGTPDGYQVPLQCPPNNG